MVLIRKFFNPRQVLCALCIWSFCWICLFIFICEIFILCWQSLDLWKEPLCFKFISHKIWIFRQVLFIYLNRSVDGVARNLNWLPKRVLATSCLIQISLNIRHCHIVNTQPSDSVIKGVRHLLSFKVHNSCFDFIYLFLFFLYLLFILLNFCCWHPLPWIYCGKALAKNEFKSR